MAKEILKPLALAVVHGLASELHDMEGAFGLGMRAGGWKCEVGVGISHHADVCKHHQPYSAVAGGLLRA